MTATLEGVRIAVLGYDADAREHALALRRAGNRVVICAAVPAASRAVADGFVVDCAAATGAEIIVVREPEDSPLWRQCEERIGGGALVVFACARALHTGRCARGGMDVVLVTGVDDPRVGCRIAVHRDVSRTALVRAIAYAHTAYGDVPVRSTSIAAEAELELASVHERSASLLALTVQSPPLTTWNADAEPEPAGLDDAGWFHAMLNRRGLP
jgi:ketol-acid reductoisomerase